MKRGFFLLLLFAGIVFPLRADDDDRLWSPAQSGLQARLFIGPPRTADYTYSIGIEFRNVRENSAGTGLESKIYCSRDDLSYTLTDPNSHLVPSTPPLQLSGGFIPQWNLILPPWAQMSFPVGRGGGAPVHGQGPGKLLSFGGIKEWVLPATGGPYWLSATLTLEDPSEPQENGFNVSPAVRRAAMRPRDGWHGTLDLPPIELPQK